MRISSTSAVAWSAYFLRVGRRGADQQQHRLRGLCVGGDGVFTPGAGSDPHLGRPGTESITPEVRVEMTAPAGALGAIAAALVLFLASSEARNITGQVVATDGGMTM